MPAAPAAFSTMTRWPSVAVRRSAITRATMSVGPPAPNGTMMVIGLLGNGWACACGMIDNAIAAQARSPIMRRWIMMLPPGDDFVTILRERRKRRQ